MPKLSTPLTTTKIKNIKAKDKNYLIGDGDNLYLEIKTNGKKNFAYIYTDKRTKKRKYISIGEFGLISLAQARAKKDEIKQNIYNGIDLKDKFKDFQNIYDEWIKTKNVSKRHLLWIKNKFKNLFLPKFEKMDIKNITRKDIILTLEPFLLDKKMATVRKLLGVLDNFYLT